MGNIAMPKTDIEPILLDIADTYLVKTAPEDRCAPNPLLKDARCQERAVYFSLLFRRLRGADGDVLTEIERINLGAGILLSVNTGSIRDDFDQVMHYTLKDTASKGFVMPPVRGVHHVGVLTLMNAARKILADNVSDFIVAEGGLSAVDVLHEDGSPYFIGRHGAHSLKFRILPFYAGVIGVLEVIKRMCVRIAVRSIQLVYDVEKNDYALARQDVLFFPPESTQPGIDTETVFLVEGYQIVKKGDESNFVDDVIRMRSGALEVTAVIASLAAVHPQLDGADTPLYAQDTSSSGVTTLYDRYRADYAIANDKGLKDKVYGDTRPTENVSFQIRHIRTADLSSVRPQ